MLEQSAASPAGTVETAIPLNRGHKLVLGQPALAI